MAAGATAATLAFSAAVQFDAGDRLRVLRPSGLDATARRIFSANFAARKGSIGTVRLLPSHAAAANSGGGNAVSGNVTLSTSVLHDVIVLCVFNQSGSHNGNNPIAIFVCEPHGRGLAWTKRSSKTFGKGAVEIWYTIAPAMLSSDTITFNFASTTDDWSCMAFAVSGADTSAPWDTNGALPASNDGSGGTPSVSVTTTARNAFVFAFAGSESYFSPSSPQAPLARCHRAFQHGVGPGIRVEPCGIRHRDVAAIKPLADLQFNKRRLGDARRRHR